MTHFRGVAQFGSAPVLGTGGRRFKSCLPDHKNGILYRSFFYNLKFILKYYIIYIDILKDYKMKITWILTCPFSTNTYFVWDETTKEAAIVDPGDDFSFIVEKINEFEIKPVQIWLTHGHFDHMFACGRLSEYYKIPVYMNSKDIELFDIFHDQAVAYGFDESNYLPITNIINVDQGDEITLGSETVKVLSTPGHSKGSLCFVTSAGVLCGDLIFNQSIGRTDLYGGDFSTLINSIKTKILPLNEETILYPGHGIKTKIKSEKKGNPFLQDL